MKPRIIIIVEGGIVQNVSANTDIEYIVIDYDKHADDPILISEPSAPDMIDSPLHIGSLGDEKTMEQAIKQQHPWA